MMHALEDPPRATQIRDLYAGLGRYMHQPIDVLGRMPLSELVQQYNAVVRLLDKEQMPGLETDS